MSELWIPETDKVPNIDNMYDMMLVMQEALLGMESSDDRIKHARFAIDALGAHFDRMEAERRSVAMHAQTALYEHDEESIRMVYDIGIRGEISSIKYVHLANLQFGLSLSVDTSETFSPLDPDACEPTQLELVAPITGVQYIETLAS